MTAATWVSATTALATARPDSLEWTVPEAHAPTTALAMVTVSDRIVSAKWDGLDSIAR